MADGASYTTYTYQGNFTTVVDPAGKWKQYANDAFGNLVTVLEPDPTANPVLGPPASPPAYPVGAAPTGMLLTSYAYDQLNHLTQVAMPRSTANGLKTQLRTFVYSPTTQWVTSATNPENGTVSYTYNGDGTLATKTDAKNNIETYTYDAYQRLTSIPDRQQTFTYDTCPTNAVGCVSMAGQLMQATFGSDVGPNQLSFEYNYAYTPAGKVSSKTLEVQSANHLSPITNAPAVGTVPVNYTYDNQGAMTRMSYSPNFFGSNTLTLTYTLDAMERPTGLTDNNNNTWVSGVTYTPANQTSLGGRAYNNLLQLTQAGQITYSYSSTNNNGQITSSHDVATGETVSYQYDALRRLSSASGANWTENYVYDGYGNLTQMNPSGTAQGMPSLNLTVALDANNVPNNRIAGGSDNNGNQSGGVAGTSLQYDVANRVSEVNGSSYYGYDSDNRRIYYRNASGGETIYLYGADGRKLTSYTMTFQTVSGVAEIEMNPAPNYGNVYFTGMLVAAEGGGVTTDRIGSVRTGPGTLSFQSYPYGVEYATTANDREKYATYTRDSLTGLDYAMNRYYWSQWGRFLSPHPSWRSAMRAKPQSWNRYAYALNDPVNNGDPTGLSVVDCDWGVCPFDPWGAAGSLFGDDPGGLAPGGIFLNGPLAAQEAANEQEYNEMVQLAMAAASQNATPDPDCVQDAISAAAADGGLDLDGFTAPWVQIVGDEDPSGGNYGETELNFSGSEYAINGLITQMCGMNFYNNGTSAKPLCPGNAGSSLLVGPPHAGFTGNFRSPGLLNSIQVNTNIDLGTGDGDIQIDVDPYNPAADPILGLLLHGVFQVLPNKITGGDNTYGCVQ